MRNTILILAASMLLVPSGLILANQDKLVPTGGAKPDLFLIYTGDVIGYVEPCG